MTLRQWATPMTIGGFVLIAVTGILMFFHLDRGLSKLAHEWLGWLLVLAVVGHLSVNFGMFRRHLESRSGLVIVCAFLGILLASFLAGGNREAVPPHVMAAQALLDTRLDVVAKVGGKDVRTLQDRLRIAGFDIQPGQSLREAAGDDRGEQMRALGVALTP